MNHGTRACYVSGCRREECRDANRAYARRLKRLSVYGRPTTDMVPAGPVRDHVNHLRGMGVGWRRIAALAGISPAAIKRLLWGDPPRGHAPSSRVRPRIAAAILAVRADLAAPAACAYVDATGTHRRLRALVAIGWSQCRLAALLGFTRSNFGAMMTRSQVRGETARAVAELYDELWNRVPVAANRFEQAGISRARRIAAARGWAPPMAWDDDRIDDPVAVPDLGEPVKARASKLPPVDEVVWLRRQGVSVPDIADRFGTAVDSVQAALRRHHQTEAA